jgi:hypothetical protein
VKKRTICLFAALVCFGLIQPAFVRADQAAGQNAAVVKNIGYIKTSGGLEVTVSVDGGFVMQTLVLSGPTRLVIDVAPASKIEAQSFYAVDAFGMMSIRTGQFQPQIARVIFDFSGPLPAYTIQKTETGFVVSFTSAPAPADAPPARFKAVEKPIVRPRPRPVETPPSKEKEIESPEVPTPKEFANTSIGFMVGTYSSSSADFNDVFGSTTKMQYGLNLTRTLAAHKNFQLDASFEIRAFSATGSSTLTGTETKFSMTPITIGGRLLYQTKYALFFVGAGKDFTSYEEKSAIFDTQGSASGYHYQAGVYIIIPKVESLRVKLYYKFTKMNATENEIDIGLGGNEYGIGLSYGFNVWKKGLLKF